MDPNTVVEVTKTFTEATKYDPTVLYYTYSTIAQTLAAAFAFVGAFILFYLQSVNQTCERISDNIFESLNYGSHIKRLFLSGGWESYRKNFEEYMITDRVKVKISNYLTKNIRNPTDNEKREFREEIKRKLIESYTKGYSPVEIVNLWHTRCNLIEKFKFFAVINAITIVVSLILLSLSAILCNYSVLFWFPLVILILLSIYCVTKCVKIIWKTFSHAECYI